MGKRAVGDWIIKRKYRFQMRSRWGNHAGMNQVSTGGKITQNEPGGIVALAAQTQQTLVQAQRQIEFAADQVMERLPMGNLKELRGGTQLLPQLSCAGIGLARFRRGDAFDGLQHRAEGTQKFELLSMAFRGVRQQR